MRTVWRISTLGDASKVLSCRVSCRKVDYTEHKSRTTSSESISKDRDIIERDHLLTVVGIH